MTVYLAYTCFRVIIVINSVGSDDIQNSFGCGCNYFLAIVKIG